MRRYFPLAIACLLAGSALAYPGVARADRSIIKQPGNRVRYSLELEPHLLLAAWNAPGRVDGEGFGLGLRASIPIVENGFVASINNSVAIGFGLDLVYYDHAYRDYCVVVQRPGPDQVLCSALDSDDALIAYVPVVMQWNFWLSENWSVFGEPGLGLRFISRDDSVREDDDFDVTPLLFFAGGRYHFSEAATLTMRLGFHHFSVGVSFLL